MWVWGASINTGQGSGQSHPRTFSIFDNTSSRSRLLGHAELVGSLTGGGEPERVTSARVSAGFFETLGIMPAYGRTFTLDESVTAMTGCYNRSRIMAAQVRVKPAIIGESVMLNEGATQSSA